ncbi:hypothetical protein BDY19DRAFT_993786 [Irpex rosettiformis]|uniref:Uncharacterized protein n=1 Tax=Irpex rosettiformis TaxID=378272 RepID=A0ACB8U406_9APHY|nr:hypothetical protein BDY19DRAFT_993786 [Irpex rosettiformis]
MPHQDAVPAPQPDLEDGDNETYPDELAEYYLDSEDEDDCREPTSHRRALLQGLELTEIARRIEDVIATMREHDLDVPTMLYYMSFLQGQKADTGIIRYARTSFLTSEDFPWLIRRWRLGRRRKHNKGYATRSAREALDEWSVENVNFLINEEMRALAPNMLAPINGLSEEKLLQVNLHHLEETISEKAPTLWSVLHHASSTPSQLKRITYKTHAAPIIMMAGICSYRCSQHRCLLQQLNSVYFKASGLAAKAHDTTHLYGISMSHSWVYHLIDKISEDAKKELMIAIHTYPFRASHDNLNLGFKVFEQRTHKQSRFDSGTAATVYVIKDPAAVWPDREQYQARRVVQSKHPITARTIWNLELAAAPHLHQRAIHQVIKFLIDAAPFDFETYEFKDSDVFAAPSPRDQLPSGPEHIAHQYILDTVQIESASQEGTRKCLDEWMRQLGLDGEEVTQKDMDILKKLLVFIGDQLTTVRIRSIKKDRSEDFNFVQRCEHFVETPGWFHTQLNEELSIHKQYYSTHKPFGLQHGIEILKRKGLHTTSVKGVFHHTMQETLWHIAIARFRDLWVTVARVDHISDLRAMSPTKLQELATTIVDKYASTAALIKYQQMAPEDQDKVLIHGIQFCRDLLNYVELDSAMKTGDVERVQDLLPRLLFRFNGGGSSNYAIELLELLQGLEREWTPELKTFILHYCWLAKTSDRPGDFLAFDMMQEHNIRDVKHTFAAHGPNATWAYIKKISASIPTQRKIKDHIEAEFNHFRRGKSHTTPDWEADVANLQDAYRVGKVHVYQRVRRGIGKIVTSPPDFISIGSSPQKLQSLISQWTAKRVASKSTEEDYAENDPDVIVPSREHSGSVSEEAENEWEESWLSGKDKITALLSNLQLN